MSTRLLEYEVARPKRGRFLRRFAYVIALVAVVAAGIHAYRTYGPRVRYLLDVKKRSDACRTFTLPAGTVVWTEDAAESSQLIKKQTPPGYHTGSSVGVGFSPRAWWDFNFRPQSGFGLQSGVWHWWGSTAFLHERRTPSGRRLLVHVGIMDRGQAKTVLRTRVIDPGTLLHPRWLEQQCDVVTRAQLMGPDDLKPYMCKLRVLAGQPDADDPTKWTIDYTVDGVAGSVEMALTDDLHLVESGPGIRRVQQIDGAVRVVSLYPPPLPEVGTFRDLSRLGDMTR